MRETRVKFTKGGFIWRKRIKLPHLSAGILIVFEMKNNEFQRANLCYKWIHLNETMAQISAIVLFLARAASLQRAKFRPESVRFFFVIWAKMKPQARKQNERVYVCWVTQTLDLALHKTKEKQNLPFTLNFWPWALQSCSCFVVSQWSFGNFIT